jgi:hypothetical protein
MLLRMPWLCARDQQQSDAWRLHHGTRQPPFAWSVFDHVPGLIIQVSWRSTEYGVQSVIVINTQRIPYFLFLLRIITHVTD